MIKIFQFVTGTRVTRRATKYFPISRIYFLPVWKRVQIYIGVQNKYLYCTRFIHQHHCPLSLMIPPLIVFSKNINFCEKRLAVGRLKVQEKVVASCLYLFLPASYWKFMRNSLKIVSIYFLPQGYWKFTTKSVTVNASCQYLYISASFWKFTKT